MKETDYLRDISDIRSMMQRSTQFLSLSGLSGVLAGVYALSGAWIADGLIASATENDPVRADDGLVATLLVIAAAVLLLSLGTALLMTHYKAARRGEKLLNSTGKRLAVNFLVPLATGGIFALIMLYRDYFALLAPVTLIFYGLSCVNASKYTFRDVRFLGMTVIAIGLAASLFPGYGLVFWALGFGVCHIVYGAIMYMKYDRK